ncbi:DUF3017 domain-containing protein [Streptomyces sp. NPDC020412]|uniref:DUF3017 domain-containing protein n=1 Tax=Streptomyces sp. NPDC020412 TaxID=3365073 RepID=UPI0037B86DDE
MGVRTNGDRETGREAEGPLSAGRADEQPDEGASVPAEEARAEAGADGSGSSDAVDGADGSGGSSDVDGVDDAGDADDDADADGSGAGKGFTRRPPQMTTDTARPEGGGRAAPGDAPAPARQWPLLTVLGLVALGLVVVGTDPFSGAFRLGTLIIGAALITAAVMRRVLPSVGMLAVRSRFTDMITYGLLGTVICLLAAMAQPNPWLDVPFLEDVVHVLVGRETR